MSDPLGQYFAAEKQAAVLCLALGATAVAVSVWVWRTHPAFRTMAVPLLVVSLIQLGFGVGLLTRTDRQVATLRADMAREPAAADHVAPPRLNLFS